MSTNQMKRQAMRKLIPLAGLVIAMCAPMPTAHADPSDSQVSSYLAELQRRGVSYSTPDAAVNVGVAACRALHSGNSFMAVIKEMRNDFSGHDTGNNRRT